MVLADFDLYRSFPPVVHAMAGTAHARGTIVVDGGGDAERRIGFSLRRGPSDDRFDRLTHEFVVVERSAPAVDGNFFVERVAAAPQPAAPVAKPVASDGAIRARQAFTREAYEAITKLHPGYHAVPEAVLAALPASYPDGTPGEMTYYEPMTGYRDEIGIRAKSAQLWAISMDPRARANMIANARASRWFPIHVSAPAEPGQPTRPWRYPHKSITSSTTNDLAVLPDTVGNPKIKVDIPHEPQFLFDFTLSMKLEGNAQEYAWGLNEMKYWVAYNYLKMVDNQRGFTKGIFHPGSGAVTPRGSAWMARSLFMLALVLPENDEWRPWVIQSIEENILFLDGVFRTGDYDLKGPRGDLFGYGSWEKGAYRNDFGFMSPHNAGYGVGTDGRTAYLGAFQSAFQAQVWLWGYRLGLPLRPEVQKTFDTFTRWVAKFPIMMFGKTDDPASYDYRRAGPYALAVGKIGKDEQSVAFFKTPAEFFAANSVGLPPLPADDHSFRDGAVEAGEFGGRWVDMMVPGLTMAVEIGVPGAADGYARLKASRQFKLGGSWPFCYLPSGEYYDAPSRSVAR